ncbi:MAG: DUF1579 family protein [Planctomycetota bacterium]|nr:DUF1579 family protein [Planctomycetota bacterium]
MVTTRELSVTRGCLCLAARRRSRAVTRLFEDKLRPHGLRATQFSVLAALALKGPTRVGELADLLGLERTTLTRSADLLERNGWVDEGPADDARERPLRLTPAGREKLEAAFPAWQEGQAEAAAGTPSQQPTNAAIRRGDVMATETTTTPTEMTCAGMPEVKPQAEHAWLRRLVGEWTWEMDAPDGKGKLSGTETVRTVGDVWIVGEGSGAMGSMVITLGYDPAKKRFVGTWIGSMMTHMWIYDGELDAAGGVLTLRAEGPSMTGDGTTKQYKDVIELLSDDRRTLSGHCQSEDGTWQQLMTMELRRKA